MLFRALAVLVLCSFLAGGSLFAWRFRPAPVARATPVLCLPSAQPRAPIAPPSAPAEELPWVNPNVAPGLLQLVSEVRVGRPLRSLRASTDGSRVAVRTSDGVLRLLRREGTALALDRVVSRDVAAFAMHPSGLCVATISADGTLRFISLTGTASEEAGHIVAIGARLVAFHRGHLAWLDQERAFHRMDEYDAREDIAPNSDEHRAISASLGNYYCSSFMRDDLCHSPNITMPRTTIGRVSLSTFLDEHGDLALNDAASGQRLMHGRMQRGRITGLEAAGEWLFSAGDDGYVRLWRVRPDFAPTGVSLLPASTDDETPELIEGAFDDELGERRLLLTDNEGAVLVTPQGSRHLHVRHVLTGRLLPDGAVLARDNALEYFSNNGRMTHRQRFDDLGSVHKIETSGDGRFVLAMDWGAETAVVHDRRPGAAQPLRTIRGAVRDIEASPSGNLFAAGMTQGAVLVWPPAHEDEAREFHLGMAAVRGLEFDGRGSILVVASSDEQVRVLNLATGRVVTMEPPSRGTVSDVRASGDGTRIAASYSDGALVVWDAADGRTLRRFCCHEPSSEFAAFSPDNTLVLSTDPTGTLRLWSMASGNALAQWSHLAPVQYPSFSSDGATLRWYTETHRITWPLANLTR